MTTFNPILKRIEIRVVCMIRKYTNMTRATALQALRKKTGGKGLDTADCMYKLAISNNKRLTVKELFGV